MGGIARGSAQEAIRLCSLVRTPQNIRHCLAGVVQDSFWDTAGAQDTLLLCRLLKDPDNKSACYETILQRARELYRARQAHSAFCQEIEEVYRPHPAEGFPC